MSALRELQFAFGEALLHGPDNEVLSKLKSQGLPGMDRFNVYRNNFYITLGEALRATYPVVDRLVGNRFFDQMSRHYIQRYPSVTGNLNDYGRQFPDFLAGYAPLSRLPYIPDVARLEWSWHASFHAAPSDDGLNLAGFSDLDDGEQALLGFDLDDTACLLHSEFPVLRIWQANQDDADVHEAIDLAEGEDHLLVLRRQMQVEVFRLGCGEYWLLACLAAGHTLSEALETALENDAAFDLQASLSRHMRLGTLSSWHLVTAGHSHETESDLMDIYPETINVQLH